MPNRGIIGFELQVSMIRSSFFLSPLLCAISLFAFGGAPPAISVSGGGGITLNGNPQSFLFTWNAPLPVTGSGWAAGESITIVLHGPINSPGVAASDVMLGPSSADGQGNLSAAPVIPYDSGVVGSATRIPRPGLYEVHANGTNSGSAVAGDFINLCPDTYTGAGLPYDWGHERGGRDGVLPGPLQQYSPERFDPEWPTVWDELPVEVYATVASTGGDGGNQPAIISPSDNPATHYGHDSNSFVIPDGAYQWLIGTSNYYAGDPDSAELGRLEVEWETLNAGNVTLYGQGSFGLPLWAKPTAGDRVYLVGRWILDAGHPEVGDRTEMHPPRLVATMRERPAIASSGASAAQVDIYVSGHGGGANHMPAGLSATLDQGGWGGGRIRDALDPSEQDTYYRAGPLSSLFSILVIPLIEELTGASLSGQIYPSAGPTAFSWGNPSAEEHAINDMDYDFDVPLPPPPAGAAAPAVEVTQQPQHTTAVAEMVTFTNPDSNGLPTTAHVHLPYNGADNGIYARTLKFSWDTSTPPPNHFQVSLNRIDVIDTAGKWQMWADVSGLWSYLSGMAPALLQTASGSSVMLPANQADVWLGPDDTLRVYVQGYRANCVDDYFGKLFGMSSYQAGLTFLENCGPTDNDDLGGAVLELQPPVAPGEYNVPAADSAGNSHFAIDFTVNQAP
jgi:hypothetical protein